MHVFVTGASGYIGGAVATRLLRAGHTVTGLTRDVAKPARSTSSRTARNPSPR
ncbi:NAD-dependent epimerase/dehydratase family protein [Saccharothrix sp. ALI-22-I]|uniref:NAD-dependent epimerase/dehydratase family protein n=1 Tax=Saccharothrix sp. ALI-22-I TaxID=1933778 RepID=UPI00117A3C8F|nr:NAD-dependent epimerase/dehydratase family protein [Saccharothrix sp. ALI-22-I]